MFLQKLNEVLTSKKTFVSDRISAVGFGISALINIIHWSYLISKISPGPDPLVLHYNVVHGPQLVGKSVYSYAIPLTAFLFLILNFFLASSLFSKEKLNSQFLAYTTVAVQLVFLAGTLTLIFFND